MALLKTEDLLVEIKGQVLYVTLNRPDRLNAFSPELLLLFNNQ